MMLIGCIYSFIAFAAFRAAVLSFLQELLFVLAFGPFALGCVALLVSYMLTVCFRPNSMGPIDWYTAALLQAVLASLAALVAAPLQPQLAAWFGISVDALEWHIELVLPHLSLGDPFPRLPTDWRFETTIRYAWWLPSAVILLGGIALFVLQYALSLTLFACCGSTPAMWRYTRIIDDEETMVELRDLLGKACAEQQRSYKFGMALRDAWRVSNPELDAAMAELQSDFRAREKPSHVARLFHGTRRESAKAILDDGFVLPPHAGMFGKGIYFADTPLKSLQYCGWGLGWKFMLICDVELGNTLVQRSARPDFAPQEGAPIAESNWIPSVFTQPSYDSVSAPASFGGLRVPEYVVYNTAQAAPRFILAVEQVARESPDALVEGAGQLWAEERARRRRDAEARQRAAAKKGGGEAEAEAEQEETQGGRGETITAAATPPGDPFLLNDGSVPARAPLQPQCRYGAKCFRRNVEHWRQFDHPPSHPGLCVVIVPPGDPTLMTASKRAAQERGGGGASSSASDEAGADPELGESQPLPAPAIGLPLARGGSVWLELKQRQTRFWQRAEWKPHCFSIDVERAALLFRDEAGAFGGALPLVHIAAVALQGGDHAGTGGLVTLRVREEGGDIYEWLLRVAPTSAADAGDRADWFVKELSAAMTRLPKGASPDVNVPPSFWCDEERYLATPTLSVGERRVLEGSGVGALHQFAEALCTGSRAEVGLKVACLPVMIPLGAAAAAIYFVVTRGFRLIKRLVVCLPFCLCGCCKSTVSTIAFLATSFQTVCFCVSDFVARHCKTCCFAVYDGIIAPIHRGVVVPSKAALKAAWTGCMARVLNPCFQQGWRLVASCTPVALARCCAVWDHLLGIGKEADHVVTEALLRTMSVLIQGGERVISWLSMCGDAIAVRAVHVWRNGLRELVISIGMRLESCARATSSTLEAVGRAICARGRACYELVEPVGRVVCQRTAELAQLIWTHGVYTCTWCAEQLGGAIAATANCLSHACNVTLVPMAQALWRCLHAAFSMAFDLVAAVATPLCQILSQAWQMVLSAGQAIASAAQTVGSQVWPLVVQLSQAVASAAQALFEALAALVDAIVRCASRVVASGSAASASRAQDEMV